MLIQTGCGVRAESVVDVLRQNRGEAWSMGGRGSLEENIITIPSTYSIQAFLQAQPLDKPIY